MTGKIIGFEIPTRYASFGVCGLAFVMLMFANLLPASAAAVGVQPGVAKALGQPAAAINSAASPDLLLVRRGGRKAHRGSRGYKRRHYRSRRYKRRHYRRPSIYFSIPLYAYPRYYSYRRPYYGRCESWRRRCAANWGYRNPDYYGCMRYHGCR